MRPASRSASSHGRCWRHATRLCTCSISTCPNQSSWSASWARASSTDDAQILRGDGCVVAPALERRAERPLGAAVHRRAVEERGCRRRARRRRPREPCRRRRRTSATSRARRPGRASAPPSMSRGTPDAPPFALRRRLGQPPIRPTEGGSRATHRWSTVALTSLARGRGGRPRRRPRRTADRRRGRGPCGRGAARRRPRASRRRRRPLAARARPAARHRPARRPWATTARARRSCGARRRGGARAGRPRTRGPRGPAAPPSASRGVRDLGEPGRAVAERGAGADDPRADGRDRHVVPRVTRDKQRRRDARALQIRVEAGRDGDRLRDEPARPELAHGVRERHRQRSTGDLDVGDARARRARPRPARPGCAACSRRPACRRAAPPPPRPPPRSASPPAAACTAASSRARRAPPGGRARASGSRASTSKPPEPSPSSRACMLTSTSSPSATGPVRRGYATHGSPSTSRRTRPGSALDGRP